MTEPTRRRLREQGGFTLAVTMGILLISSIICVAAFQAASGAIGTSADNSNRKQAYAAAESGVAWYLSKLAVNPDYWQECASGVTQGVPDPVNQPNAAESARKWKTLTQNAAGADKSEFSIALLPATGTTCSTTNPSAMLSPTDGSFRIRSTGRYRGEKRTIVTSMRRLRFLDFIYFTDYETLDYTVNGGSPDCARYRALRPSTCTTIQFASADEVNGPLHTNDSIIYCGSPTFGRRASDNIHVSGPTPGYARNSSCGASGTPNFQGTFRFGQRALQMPPSNASLETLTTPGTTGQGYKLTGTHYIRFNGNGTMTLDVPGTATQPWTVSLPPNGVIYVEDNGCTNADSPQATDYSDGPGCGNAYVSGTADRSVTVAAEKDIIVAPTTNYTGTNAASQFDPATAGAGSTDANLIAAGTLDTATEQLSGNVQIGLIANGFVRVYHRIDPSNGSLASGVRNVRIDAAILSLQHSFIVDNWSWGPSPGTLTVHGAISQRFRGPVGTGSGATISTGYVKNYVYDDRLRFRSPPHFLDPVNAAWEIGRSNELIPAL